MRILQVIHGFLPQFRGGTELYLLGLCRQLRRLGHDVHIVTGTTHSGEEAHIEDYTFDSFPVKKVVLSGSYLEHWTRSFSPEATRLFAQALAEVKPDIVHVQHWYRLSRTLIETCHRMGVPAVCTLHDLWTTCPRIFRIRDESFCENPLSGENCGSCVPRFPWMEEQDTIPAVDLFQADFANELSLAHRIIVPSAAHGEVISKVVDLPQERMQVIPHGTIVDLQENRPEAQPKRRQVGKGRISPKKNPIRLGLWGHLFHMKGAHLVLDALQTLRHKTSFQVHIWGEVTEPQYKERLETASIGLDVHWHGAFVPEDLRTADLDLAVIPSLCSESFSFVLDEAFDLNLPAIVPRRGALEERVGTAGTTFIAEDPRDLARVFKTLLKKPDLIDRWRSAIQAPTAMVWHGKEIQFVYQDVLKRAERTKLTADVGLPWRRLEFQAAVVRRQEEMMFGYLGHINREVGRGDHFEKEMRQLMKEKETWAKERVTLEESIATLGKGSGEAFDLICGEVSAFRDLISLPLEDAAQYHYQEPKIDGLEVDFPKIGSAQDLIAGNKGLISNYVKGAKERLKELDGFRESIAKLVEDYDRRLNEQGQAHQVELEEVSKNHVSHAQELIEALQAKEEIMTLLAQEIEMFREVLLLEEDEVDAQLLSSSQSVHDDVHVPGLGSLGEVKQTNRTIVEEFSQSAPDDNQVAEEHLKVITLLAQEIMGFRSAVVKLFDSSEEFQREEPDGSVSDFSVPYLGSLNEVVAINSELMKSLETGFAVLENKNSDLVLMIELLGSLIGEMRRGIEAVQEQEDYVPQPIEGLEGTSRHVPGLGDLTTIHRVDTELLLALHEEVARLRSCVDSPDGTQQSDLPD